MNMAEKILDIKAYIGEFPTMFDITEGDVKIVGVKLKYNYPIRASSGNCYTADGKCYDNDKFPSLYWPGTEIKSADPPKTVRKKDISLRNAVIKADWRIGDSEGDMEITLHGITRDECDAIMETDRIVYKIEE